MKPIKARAPEFVLGSGTILLLWTVFLCLQRIIADDYPCWLSLIQGFLGLILLCNLYIARCLVLFTNYHASQISLAATMKDSMWAWFYRRYGSPRKMFKVLSVISIVLFIPGMIVSLIDTDTRTGTGDGCDRSNGDILLWVYTVLYVIAFLFCTYKLRGMTNTYKIKEELVLTAVIAIVTVTLWIGFNNADSVEEFNDEQFPVSTACLLVGIMLVFCISIGWPLMMTVSKSNASDRYQTPQSVNLSQMLVQHGNENDSRILEQLLESKEMRAELKELLMEYFEIETLLFLEEIKMFQNSCEHSRDRIEMVFAAEQIYDKFISSTAMLRLSEQLVSKEDSSVIHEKLSNLDIKSDTFQQDIAELFKILESDVERYLVSYWVPRLRVKIEQQPKSDLEDDDELVMGKEIEI